MISSATGASLMNYSYTVKLAQLGLVQFLKGLRDVINVWISLVNLLMIFLFLPGKRLGSARFQLGESLELKDGWRKRKNGTIAPIVTINYSGGQKGAETVSNRLMLTDLSDRISIGIILSQIF